MLVSQRPGEVEATVLSQCNSWLVLRITNESDSAHVRAVLPDSMSGLSAVLAGLRRQEAILPKGKRQLSLPGHDPGPSDATNCQGRMTLTSMRVAACRSYDRRISVRLPALAVFTT